MADPSGMAERKAPALSEFEKAVGRTVLSRLSRAKYLRDPMKGGPDDPSSVAMEVGAMIDQADEDAGTRSEARRALDEAQTERTKAEGILASARSVEKLQEKLSYTESSLRYERDRANKEHDECMKHYFEVAEQKTKFEDLLRMAGRMAWWSDKHDLLLCRILSPRAWRRGWPVLAASSSARLVNSWKEEARQAGMVPILTKLNIDVDEPVYDDDGELVYDYSDGSIQEYWHLTRDTIASGMPAFLKERNA